MALIKAPSLIETERLVLTAPRKSDAQAVYERYASDPEVTRYLGWARHQDLAETAGFLEFSASQWQQHGVGPYLIRSGEDGRLLGGTGLAWEPGNRAMTGYVLAKDAWQQGYATETLRAIVELARGIALVEIYALCHPQHQASRHVLQKCGFQRDLSWTRQMEFPNFDIRVPQDVFCYRLQLQASATGEPIDASARRADRIL